MEKDKSHIPQTPKKVMPPLTLQRKIGGTTYIVSSRFNEQAKEDMVAKMKRLILTDTQP